MYVTNTFLMPLLGCRFNRRDSLVRLCDLRYLSTSSGSWYPGRFLHLAVSSHESVASAPPGALVPHSRLALMLPHNITLFPTTEHLSGPAICSHFFGQKRAFVDDTSIALRTRDLTLRPRFRLQSAISHQQLADGTEAMRGGRGCRISRMFVF